MTFTTVTTEPDKPRWVISFPRDVPPEVVKHIREQMTDPDDVRPIVLAEGGTMYDARQGPPMTLEPIETTVETTYPVMLYGAVLLNAIAVLSLVVFVLVRA